MTTLLGLVFGCGIAASQTPRAEQTMNSKRQYIAEVAALTSMGHLDQLRTVLIGGLNSGITVSELKEVMVHSYAYCGFPRALRGLQTLVAVLDERKAKGIRDNQGREASPIADVTFLQRFRAPRQMRRKPTMPSWPRKSKYSLKNISLPSFSSGTC